MTLNRVLVLAGVVCFALVALSAFSDEFNFTEMGWLALALAFWAGSTLALGVGIPTGRRSRARVLR
ncbi:MAG: hypothetical protein ACRD2W_09745 [Acidimicrobiales bacterium]